MTLLKLASIAPHLDLNVTRSKNRLNCSQGSACFIGTDLGAVTKQTTTIIFIHVLFYWFLLYPVVRPSVPLLYMYIEINFNLAQSSPDTAFVCKKVVSIIGP